MRKTHKYKSFKVEKLKHNTDGLRATEGQKMGPVLDLDVIDSPDSSPNKSPIQSPPRRKSEYHSSIIDLKKQV